MTRPRAKRWCGFVLAAAVLAMAPAHAARVALVIGNAAYTDGPLKNPVNDARAMDQKLATLGFKVQRIENLKRTQIGRTITAFANTVRAGDDVVVFYAGHGVQVKGINYLPAVDADIQSEEDVPLNSLNLNNLMERLDEVKAGLKILFLDACRNNPYARSFRSADRGLARVGAAPSGTLIHFATRPGSVAADGSGANGLYTSQLLRHMDSPNVPIEAMLKRVSAAVETASKGAQEPWTEGSIRGEFYFRSSGADMRLASMTPEATGVSTRGDPEDDAWQTTKAANTTEAYDAYLSEYPLGKFASAARIGKVVAQGQTRLPATTNQISERRPTAVNTATPTVVASNVNNIADENIKTESASKSPFHFLNGEWKCTLIAASYSYTNRFTVVSGNQIEVTSTTGFSGQFSVSISNDEMTTVGTSTSNPEYGEIVERSKLTGDRMFRTYSNKFKGKEHDVDIRCNKL